MKFHELPLSFLLSLTLSHVLLTANVFVNGSPSESEAPISLEDFYEFLRNSSEDFFDVQMGIMFLTASDGDEFYNLKQSVSPNCKQIAQASVKIYLNFSTSVEIRDIEEKTLPIVYKIVKNTTEQKHPLEFLCDEMEKQVLQHPTLSSMYLKIKNRINSSDSQRPTQRYFNQTFSSDGSFNFSQFFNIPGFLKATMQEEFNNQVDEHKAYNSTYNVLAKAMVIVAKNGENREKIEEIQARVLSEISLVIAERGNLFEHFAEDGRTFSFTLRMMDRFEKYFNDDPKLQSDLALAKKNIDSRN